MDDLLLIEQLLLRLFHFYTPGLSNVLFEPGPQSVVLNFTEFSFTRTTAIPPDPCLGGGSPQTRVLFQPSCCGNVRHLTAIIQKKLKHKWVTIELAEHYISYGATFSIHGSKEVQQAGCGDFPLSSDVILRAQWDLALNALFNVYSDFDSPEGNVPSSVLLMIFLTLCLVSMVSRVLLAPCQHVLGNQLY